MAELNQDNQNHAWDTTPIGLWHKDNQFIWCCSYQNLSVKCLQFDQVIRCAVWFLGVTSIINGLEAKHAAAFTQ